TLRETLASGFVAVRASPRLAATLWITILFNVFAWPVLSMVPVIGQDRLGLGADGIGLLASMDGLGTLGGAFMLPAVSRPAFYGRLCIGAVTLFLVLLPFFALALHLIVCGALLLGVGMVQSALSGMQATFVYVVSPVERRMHAMGLLSR